MRRARAATARHESTAVTAALVHRRPPPCRERRRVDRDPRGVRVRGRDGPQLAQAGPALELADRVGEPAVPGGREGHCRGISAEKAQEKEKGKKWVSSSTRFFGATIFFFVFFGDDSDDVRR